MAQRGPAELAEGGIATEYIAKVPGIRCFGGGAASTRTAAPGTGRDSIRRCHCPALTSCATPIGAGIGVMDEPAKVDHRRLFRGVAVDCVVLQASSLTARPSMLMHNHLTGDEAVRTR